MLVHDFSKISLTTSAADTSGVRREQFQGTEHLVIPIVALVEGVLHSSNAMYPELALASEFGKVPVSWNGRPVTINHPMVNGVNVSASQSPEVFQQEAIGFLFNTKVEDNKLKTEAWINLDTVAKADQLTQDTVARLETNDSADVVEVSTGLFQMMEASTGRFNGKAFMGVWREIIPDHLAILQKGVEGACSVKDGCGARVNLMRVNCACQQSSTPAVTIPAANSIIIDDNASVERTTFLRGLKNKFTGIFFAKNAGAELSDTDTRAAIQSALSAEDGDRYYDIIAVFATHVVYCSSWEGTLEQRSYEISSKGEVVLGSEKVRVRPETTFVPVTFKEDSRMNKKELIDGLIANTANKFAETDRASLEALSEDMLTKLSSVDSLVEETSQTIEVPAPVVNAATPEEFLRTVPEEMRSMFAEGLRMQQDRKDVLVKELLANTRNGFEETELRAMEISRLEKLAKLGDLPSYQGRQGGAPVTVNAADAVPRAPVAFPVKQ